MSANEIDPRNGVWGVNGGLVAPAKPGDLVLPLEQMLPSEFFLWRDGGAMSWASVVIES